MTTGCSCRLHRPGRRRPGAEGARDHHRDRRRCSRSSRATPTASVTTPSAAGRRPTDVRSDLESGERGRPPPGQYLGATDYQKYGADWSEDVDLTFGQFSSFQWMMYWGDRPAFEHHRGLILQDFFGRFPDIKVCLSEMGTVWLPYCTRKMDPRSCSGGSRRSGSSTGGRRRSSATTSSSLPTRRRTCSGSWPRWVSSPSCSAPTSRTARSRHPAGYVGPALASRRPTRSASCATTWPVPPHPRLGVASGGAGAEGRALADRVRDMPVAVRLSDRPTIGLGAGEAPVEPWNRASPKT